MPLPMLAYYTCGHICQCYHFLIDQVALKLQKINNNDRSLVNNHCLQDTLKNNMKTES